MRFSPLFSVLLLTSALIGMQKPTNLPRYDLLPFDVQRIIQHHQITQSERRYIKKILNSNMPQAEINAAVNASLKERIRDLRSFLSTSKRYYDSVRLNEFLIGQMAHVYEQDPILIALRLNTTGSFKWLKSYLIQDFRQKNRVLKDVRNMHRAIDLFLKAAAEGDIDTFMGLAKAGLSAKTTDGNGNTGLMLVVQNSEKELNRKRIVEWLLAHGAAVNVRNATGSTALLEAARFNNAGIFKLLIERGADPNIQSGLDKLTPLHWAISYENLPEVLLLLKHGLKKEMINMPDQMGTTPLRVARNKKLYVISKILAEHGAK